MVSRGSLFPFVPFCPAHSRPGLQPEEQKSCDKADWVCSGKGCLELSCAARPEGWDGMRSGECCGHGNVYHPLERRKGQTQCQLLVIQGFKKFERSCLNSPKSSEKFRFKLKAQKRLRAWRMVPGTGGVRPWAVGVSGGHVSGLA